MEIKKHTVQELYEELFALRGQPDTYAAYIRGWRCTSHNSFHQEISAALQFPYYYGENPNALSECLEDLEWLNSKNIYIIIDRAELFLEFDQQENNVYTRILNRAISFWEGKELSFFVIYTERAIEPKQNREAFE